MKIIKQIDPSSWAYAFTCTKCKSELEAGAEDVKYNYYEGDGPHPPSCTYTIECPVCHEAHTLSTKDGVKVPEVVLIKAQTKYNSRSGMYYR